MRPFGMDGGKDPRLHPMHQRLFATRGRELLPIHRELIRGQQQADSSACTAGEGSAAGSSTVPWSLLRTPPSLDPSLLTAGAAVKLLQAPLAAASIGHQAATQPAAGTAAQETQLTQSLITAAAPLAMVSSPPFSPAGFTGVAPAMFQGFAGQVPWVPQPVATMAATSPAMEPVLATSPSIPLASASPPMLPQITDELYRFVSDGISRGESWAAINNSLRAATGSNWAMTDEQLAQMYQQRSSLISHSSSPPAVPSVSAPAEASTVAAALVSRPKRTRQRISRVRSSGRIAKSKGVKSLAYLNADEFETLQELVRTHGEDWELLGRLMHIRPVDLAKNWPGYSPDTVITRPWTTPETVILDICRNTGIDCRTTAKIIGTKLPLQCRRKTIKAHHVLRDGRRLEGDGQGSMLAQDASHDDGPPSSSCSDDNYASDCRFSSPEMSPLLPATSDQMSPSTDNGGEDIEWNTGHINPMASIYLPMPTADSTSITDAVERYIKEHGAPVDWQEVSRQTGFPVFYCLENNLCSQDKSWWTYSMETFDWRLAESLRMFIQEHYPAPKEINFVAVSNFTWIVIADCILLYNSLCGEYEWTTASLNRASRLSNEGWTNAQIARYLSPTMGGSRVAQVLPQSKSRELAALPPPEMDEGSIEVVRTLVMAASGSAKDVDVPGMMESARQALAHLDSHMVDKCTLAILSTHPSFAARRPPRRSTSTNARAAPQGAQQPAPSTSSGIRTCRWSKEETLLLTSYVQTTEGTRNWRYFASVIATKSLSQCQNKFRSLNTTKKKLN